MLLPWYPGNEAESTLGRSSMNPFLLGELD